MAMVKVFEVKDLEWEPVRPAITQDVFGKALLSENVKVVLTRVAPGGKFKLHHDNYAHLFYFVRGEGSVQVGDEQFAARPGMVVQIAAGEEHSYGNAGNEDLVLLSLNLPAA
jgi:quercetin dioxygenase-like cupin family protein